MGKRYSLKRFVLVSLAAAVAVSGCDWIHYAFMNSIPLRGNPNRNPDVYVYLGIDGLSFHTVQAAMQKGAFAGSEWHLSKFVTMFPGTSDASWTRIMHTKKIGGYEIEYYDPNKDSIVNKGLIGLAKHIMPSFADFASFQFDYLHAFDYHANGYLSEANAYGDTFTSLGDSLDNLFFLLGGRVETSQVFSAYLIEYDVMGHIKAADDVLRAFMMLSDRIQKFRQHHPGKRIHFTLFSDHGMDFIHVEGDRLVMFDDELRKAGVTPVTSLGGHDPKTELFALPLIHTRVTYLGLHTHPDLVSEVSGHVTRLDSVDLAINKMRDPSREPGFKDPGAPNPLEWYEVWAEGKLALYFGFDPVTDRYYLPAGQNYSRIGLDPDFGDQDYKIAADDELFAATKDGRYPDAFYRIRTALSDTGVEFPADIVVSFRPTYGSQGFKLPGNDVTSAGFHGALEHLGTLGTLLTNERDLPDAVRADTFLELFPRMKDHIHSLGVETIEGDKNASLRYR